MKVITNNPIMSRDKRKQVLAVLTRSDTNWAVQSQKKARRKNKRFKK